MLELMGTHPDRAAQVSRTVSACVASAPLVELLQEVGSELRTLRSLTPESDVLPVYDSLYGRLHDALESADRAEAWISTREAANRLGYSLSTVQHQCAKPAGERPFRATKVGGSWRIDASSLPHAAAS